MHTIKIMLGLLATVVPAMAESHADYLASVATYKPMAGFNHVVEGKRFVGYFIAAANTCEVTVFQANADDERLLTPPTRTVLAIAAGDRAELSAGAQSALAIACTADADFIKIAPQSLGPVHAKLN